MAEAIARQMGGDRVEARSAGLTPLGWIADQTLAALEQLGYPTAGLHSKGLETAITADLDIVVSLIGSPIPGFLPGGRGCQSETWVIPDPFGEDEAVYLEVAKLLEHRIRELLHHELETELPIL
jgi:protein-tyrosine-phosphatase